jgi:hypothetical protein
MRKYPALKPIRREELKERLFGSDGVTRQDVVKWAHVISGGGVFLQTGLTSQLPNLSGLSPYALPKLPRTSTRKSCAFCSSRFILALFSSSRINIS